MTAAWVRVSGNEVACKSLARSERALSSVLASASQYRSETRQMFMPQAVKCNPCRLRLLL